MINEFKRHCSQFTNMIVMFTISPGDDGLSGAKLKSLFISFASWSQCSNLRHCEGGLLPKDALF
jgi:hypothetical protein